MSDAVYIPDPRPLWFLDSELLMSTLRAEITMAANLLAAHPELSDWLDNPETEVNQRKICFAVAARTKVLTNISETIADRYEVTRPLTKDESETFQRINNLIASDAPAWVLEMDRVIERLPWHLYAALPESLRTGRFDERNEQAEAIKALGTQEQIQAFIQGVLDQQSDRLAGRWSLQLPSIRSEYGPTYSNNLLVKKPVTKRKAVRTRDKLRMERDRVISEIDDVAPRMTEFIPLMDERNVKPQPTWSGWPGSWKKAYKDAHLRRLIHQDKSRALARTRKK